MSIFCKIALAVSFFLGGIAFAFTQDAPASLSANRSANEIVGFLLDVGTQVHWTEMDCSHFVHYLYEMAGLPYDYADSRDLYKGTEGFKRVSKPQPGDLIVWKGHAGIIVDPEQHTFLSVLTAGVKTDAYDSSYWKHRGKPRFFRHLAMPYAPNLRITQIIASTNNTTDSEDNPE